MNVIRSVLTPQHIGAVVRDEYDLGSLEECRLKAVGMNDHYALTFGGNPYILRLYNRNNFWASDEGAYRFELEWLAFLRQHSLPVSYPLPRRGGDFLGILNAPEGVRYYALFSFAPGRIYYPPDREQSRLIGQGVAAIHHVSKGYRPRHRRLRHDIAFILETPAQRIAEFLGNRRKNDQSFLASFVERARRRLAVLPVSEAAWGLNGGDFGGGNNHFTADNRLTFFDFDLCGCGWYAYDAAKFLWSIRQAGAPLESWDSFVEGYRSIRPLTDEDLETTPVLAAVRQVFHMGHVVSLIGWTGSSALNDAYWDSAFQQLRVWESAVNRD